MDEKIKLPICLYCHNSFINNKHEAYESILERQSM